MITEWSIVVPIVCTVIGGAITLLIERSKYKQNLVYAIDIRHDFLTKNRSNFKEPILLR